MKRTGSRRSFLHTLAATGLASGVGVSEAVAQTPAPLALSPLSAAGDGYIDPRKALLYECTRKEIRDRMESGALRTAIVPTASTEQHNEHLAMIMDTAGVLLVAQQAALRLYPGVIVTTPVSIGVSQHWMERKGTLTLRKEVFQEVVYDICDSLRIHGFTSILILNGHGGNVGPLQEKVAEFRSKLGIRLETCSYWDSFPADRRKEFVDSGVIPGHAAEFETAIALAAFPDRVRYTGVDYDKVKLNLSEAETKRDRTFFNESKLATAEEGERIIAHSVNWVTEKLKGMMG
ncbi:MAG: creatininase family protein [Candidatus Latescibacterota bacterium]